MMFTAGSGCQSYRQTLFAYNATRGTSTALLGPGTNGGSVVSAAPWPADA